MLSLLVALGGCSAIKLGYSNAPELAYWWLDGYADFDDAQRDRVRDDLARLHAWHRRQELPRIVQLLGRLEQLAAADMTPDQACAIEPQLRERLVALRGQVEPALAAHAATLSPAQLQHLERKFAQKNREYQREWVRLPVPDRLDKRAQELAERAETVYGSLEPAQQALLREQLGASPHSPQRVLAERQRRQQDMLAVLASLGGPAAVPPSKALEAVHALIDRFIASPDPEYRAYVEAMRQDGCRLVAVLHNSTTPAQRDFAARRLRAWQRDLTELSAAP